MADIKERVKLEDDLYDEDTQKDKFLTFHLKAVKERGIEVTP